MLNKATSGKWISGDVFDFLELKRGYDLPVSQRENGAYPIIASNGLLDYHSEYMVQGPGVVTGRSGTIGKVYFVNGNYWPLNTALYVKDFKGNDALYVSYFLRALELEKYGTGTSVPTLNRNDVHKVRVAFPPLPEQKKIARILSSVDSKLALIDQQITTTQSLKKGLMQKLFTQGVGTQDADGRWQPHTEFQETELGRVPMAWIATSFAKLKQDGVIDSIQDGNHGEKHPVSTDFVSEGIPFIMANCISKQNKLDTNKAAKISREQYLGLRIGFSKARDILLTHKGTIGLTALVDKDHGEIMLTPQVTYYRVREEQSLLPEYLHAYFQSPNFQQKLKVLAAQSTRAYLGITEQSKQLCIIPSITEQKEIACILSTVDRKLEHLQTQKAQTQQLKKGLMQKLLTGQIRVQPDPQDN
ncbi:restriction endonuclease subunit S [Endozoicomonas sp. ALE010]|uniref:restriction endonuclease subunit S n=1 Tax=Endozoicomonas sp. ALE010 TaxID=3403081 RepID=UPI003BB5174B